MTDLIDTTEMYLRTILELEEEGIVPMRARIAERLEHSGPTVSQTVARMEKHGLLTVEPDRHLELTDEGRQKAVEVMRKHRLAERLLSDIIGLDLEYVHEEACRWEHVMSDEVERRLVEVLPSYDRSPFGNPIPGLSELTHDDVEEASPGIRLNDLPDGQDFRVRIVQLNEILQVDDEQYRELTNAGITVGAEVDVLYARGLVRVTTDVATIDLDEDLSHAIRVDFVD